MVSESGSHGGRGGWSCVTAGEGEGGATLSHTATAVRSWLLESWEQPSRPIDGALLGELAHAVGGRLAREPRFRAWLQAEWTAWARQRYRRVARVAGGWVPS